MVHTVHSFTLIHIVHSSVVIGRGSSLSLHRELAQWTVGNPSMGCRVEIWFINYISWPSSLHNSCVWLLGSSLPLPGMQHDPFWGFSLSLPGVQHEPSVGLSTITWCTAWPLLEWPGPSVWIYDRPPHRPALYGWSRAEGSVYPSLGDPLHLQQG